MVGFTIWGFLILQKRTVFYADAVEIIGLGGVGVAGTGF